MKLTDQQKTIIESSGNAKIQAVAGSGKTSTLIAYAKRRSANKKILYLAFNRSVRLEAQKKFADENMTNVHIETAHSLAYKHIVSRSNYKLRLDYKPAELVTLLKIQPAGRDPLSPLLLANHVKRFASYFCNQNVLKVNDLDFKSQIKDAQAIDFVHKHYQRIVDLTRRFLADMNSGELEITHEFYLKKFQLSQPKLNYDYILFDEGQDASPVMLDVFLNQESATKLIVGDIHQQIYSWRYAINALANVDFSNFALTTSFRFPQKIADLAMQCLKWKNNLIENDPVIIHGAGKPGKGKVNVTLARTNLSLLKSAIDMIGHLKTPKKVYFEGNLSSYTYAADGASIWDVLNLSLGKKDGIRDPIVLSMQSFEQLKEYAEMSEDTELLTLIDMVDEYGKDLPYYMSKLKDCHVSDDKRTKADMIFSTVHRCKGLEYDSVTLEDDFVNESKVKRYADKKELTNSEKDKVLEEINLVYVALTRTKNHIALPPDLFENQDKFYTATKAPPKSRGNKKPLSHMEKPKKQFKKKYATWSNNDDYKLCSMIQNGSSLKEIALQFNQNEGAIRSRLKKLGM
jgi:superfamily I DNA/RNA helicase